jgi:hypothetical protein
MTLPCEIVGRVLHRSGRYLPAVLRLTTSDSPRGATSYPNSFHQLPGSDGAIFSKCASHPRTASRCEGLDGYGSLDRLPRRGLRRRSLFRSVDGPVRLRREGWDDAVVPNRGAGKTGLRDETAPNAPQTARSRPRPTTLLRPHMHSRFIF